MEEAAKSFGPMMKLMFNMVGDLCSAFYKKYGKDALPTIAAVSAKYGAEGAKIAQKMMPVKNMKDIAELYTMVVPKSRKMEIIESSNDVLHIKVLSCDYALQGTSQELCEAMMNIDKKMVSTLLGKEINIKVPKSVAAGDKYCEVIFSKK